MKRIFVVALMFAALILNGCATTYSGSGPNFNLKGAEANREIEKFSIDPNFFEHGVEAAKMGPERTNYWMSSLKPMITNVSPEAAKTLHRADGWFLADQILLLGAVAVLIGANPSSTSTAWQGPFWTLWGISVGAGIYSNVLVSDAIDQYNHDLRQKFAPQISYQFTY